MLQGEHYVLKMMHTQYFEKKKFFFHPNCLLCKKYFHKLALLLISRKLIGIYIVKTLFKRAH